MAGRQYAFRPKAAATGLGLVAFVFLANASMSDRNMRRLADNDARVVQAQTMLTKLEEVLATVTEAEARARGFLVTGDESYLQRYHLAVERVPEIFERLEQFIEDDPNWMRTLALLRHDVHARIDELDVAVALQKRDGFEAARQAVLNNKGRQLMREMRRLVNKIQGYQHALLTKWTAESRRTGRLSTAADFTNMLLGIATVGLAYFLFRREWRQREWADFVSRRLAAIVESSDDAIMGETLDGTIVSWNAGAERIYGYTAAEAIGQTIFMICCPEMIADARQNLDKVRRGQRIEPFESQCVRKDGAPIIVSISVSPIRDTGGRVIGASRISRDITQQRLLQREVLDIAAREQRRIGQDLHDGTGQELTGLAMLASNLTDELAELGLPQAVAAEKLVDGLEEALDHVRLLSKGLVPVVVDADGLMMALSDLAARTNVLSNVICEFLCEEPVTIAENQVATQLFRLAQEAVTNALRHACATRIVIALRSVGDFVILSVADNGQGLPKLLLGSSGSGLHIMRYRAELIGAKFQISANQPKGAVVTCALAKQPMPSETYETPTGELTGGAK